MKKHIILLSTSFLLSIFTFAQQPQEVVGKSPWGPQDEIGTLNVDADMIQYGSDVANLLRGNALTVRKGNIEAGKIQASQGFGGDTGDGGYYGDYNSGGYYNSYSRAASKAITGAYARGNAYSNYKEVLNQIDRLTADIRRFMTEKYKIQF